jgi:hypothetical protein
VTNASDLEVLHDLLLTSNTQSKGRPCTSLLSLGQLRFDSAGLVEQQAPERIRCMLVEISGSLAAEDSAPIPISILRPLVLQCAVEVQFCVTTEIESSPLQGLTNEELLRGVKTAWDRGWKQVKLYFMIGLPGETDADVLGIAETVQVRSRSVTDVVV